LLPLKSFHIKNLSGFRLKTTAGMTECGGSLCSNIDEIVKRYISFHPKIQMNVGKFQFMIYPQFPIRKGGLIWSFRSPPLGGRFSLWLGNQGLAPRRTFVPPRGASRYRQAVPVPKPRGG
jgi:hypothetical protein